MEMQNLEDRPPAPLPPQTVRRFHGASDRDSQGYLLPTDGQSRSSGVYSYAYQDRLDSIMASLLWLFRGRQNVPSPSATRNVRRRREEPSPFNLEQEFHQSPVTLSSTKRTGRGIHETFDPPERNSDHGKLQDLSEIGASGSDVRAPSPEAESSANTSGTSAKYLYEKIKENEIVPDEQYESTTGL